VTPPDARSTSAPRPGESARRASLRTVDRAVGDLRRGDFVLVRPDAGPALLAQACEFCTAESLATMQRLTGMRPAALITRQRAAALGLSRETDGALALTAADDAALDDGLVRALGDPLQMIDAGRLAHLDRRPIPGDGDDGALAVTALAKLARLLPAAVMAPVDRPLATERLVAATDILSVGAFDIAHYPRHAAETLTRVADARVPLDIAEATAIVAFRPLDGGQEHLAIVIGRPEEALAAGRTPLVRLHSECFTGDLLGSLRCDCGDQLRGAIAQIAADGAGVLLYLAQEGRGIGLVNKLRAYRLQDARFDTVDANEMLGYDADERIYLPAAAMLRHLGLDRVRLMTNNPDKVSQLAACGIEVAERVALAFPANGHNEFYLNTKKTRSGHWL
jgi:GTP cyclohydrolase II